MPGDRFEMQAPLGPAALARAPGPGRNGKDIAPLAETGEQLPDYVQRQSAIQGLVGEELASAIAGTG